VGLKIDTDSDHTEVNHVPTAQISESVTKNLHGEDVNEIMAKCKSPDQPDVENCVFRTRETARRTGLRDVKPSVGGGRKTREERDEARVMLLSWAAAVVVMVMVGEINVFHQEMKEAGEEIGDKRQDTDQNEDIWGTAGGQKADP